MELARFVDARMREIASQVSTVDPVKIAILAALNIADELSRCRKRYEDETGTWMEKAEEMVERLGRTLIEQPSKNTTSV
jgi:cell division protein ZapA